jgi:hypothetical protein
MNSKKSILVILLLLISCASAPKPSPELQPLFTSIEAFIDRINANPSIAHPESSQLKTETITILNQLSSVEIYKSKKDMDLMKVRIKNFQSMLGNLSKTPEVSENLSIYITAVEEGIALHLLSTYPKSITYLLETDQITPAQSIKGLALTFEMKENYIKIREIAVANFILNTNSKKNSNPENRMFAWEQINNKLSKINGDIYNKLKDSLDSESDNNIRETAQSILNKLEIVN